MLRRYWLGLLASVAAALAPACTTPDRDGCLDNRECPATFVCRATRCLPACSSLFDCVEGTQCIDGACTPDGMDAGPPRDAPLPDGASPDVPSIDGGGDVACTGDRDRDGVCDALDCAPEDETRAPGMPEICTRTTPAGMLVDEDCDEAIDEGCPLHTSAPQPIIGLQIDGASHYLPRLSADRLTLCYANGQARCATRTSTDVPFSTPITMAITGLGSVTGVAISEDGTEWYVEGTPLVGEAGLYRTTRTGMTFAAPTFIAARYFHPALSPDGLELFAQYRPGGGMPTEIHRATRATRTASFGPLTPVDLDVGPGIGVGAPFVLADGGLIHTIAAGTSISNAVAHRAPDGATFDRIEPWTLGDPTATQLAYYPDTRELFFVGNGAWSTGAYTIFRVQVCRDVGCARQPTWCDGTLSPDEAHCYVAGSAPARWVDASAGCGADGAHLVTVHSAAEAVLADTPATSGRWTAGSVSGGALVWGVPGEAASYAPWAAGEPSGAPSVVVSTLGGTVVLRDEARMNTFPYVCESERWPTW